MQRVMTKKSYIQWVDKYVTPKYFPQPYIDDNDNFQQSEKRAFTGTRCYGLRCAVLHSGNEDLSRNHMDLSDGNYIIVLDTNVLLNVYRYSPEFSEFALECLRRISDNIYLPATVRLEFGKHCRSEFSKMEKRFASCTARAARRESGRSSV